MEYTKEQVGAFLRKGRKAGGFTQESFAEAMDCNTSYYGDLERGKYYPSLGFFLRMVSYLNLSVDKFLQRSDEIQSDTYQQLLQAINNCTENELQILLENAQTLFKHRIVVPTKQDTL